MTMGGEKDRRWAQGKEWAQEQGTAPRGVEQEASQTTLEPLQKDGIETYIKGALPGLE